MNTEEFSNAFDVLLNSHNTPHEQGITHAAADIVLNEYEKSVFLTEAQREIVVNLYNGKNIYSDSFESTEEIRRYLDGLVKTKEYTIDEALTNPDFIHVDSTSTIFKLEDDVAFITLETVSYSDEETQCKGEAYTARVYPITHDEYDIIKENPFRGPTKYKALRLDYGDSYVEIISKHSIGKYFMKYLSKPKPIILENLDGLEIEGYSNKRDCELNSMLHDVILKRAVVLALAAKSGSRSDV